MINPELRYYVEKNIFPLYEQVKDGHGLEHIEYVIRRSLKFADELEEDLNLNMVYAIAAYHDIARPFAKVDPVTGKDNHHELGAEYFLQDDKMREFFTDEERMVIAYAIFEHRASLKKIPRSVYGKIISTADRDTDITTYMRRAHQHYTKHYPNMPIEVEIVVVKRQLIQKYGIDGYAADMSFVPDYEYRQFLDKVRYLMVFPDKFETAYRQANYHK